MAHDLDLVVVVDDDAAEQDALLARGYWEIAAVADSQVAFAHTMASLAREVGVRHPGTIPNRVRQIAYATSPEVTCASCPVQVQVRSRQQLKDALNPPKDGSGLRCASCTAEQERQSAQRRRRIVQRDRARAEIAGDRLLKLRRAGDVATLIKAVSPATLLVAVVMLRERISQPAHLGWIHDLGLVVSELHAHRIAVINRTHGLFEWNSPDPDQEQRIRGLAPKRATFDVDSLPGELIEAEVRRRRHELADDITTRRAARATLLDEMTAAVAHALDEYNLAERNDAWKLNLTNALEEQPTATLAQVATAAPRIVATAHATYKDDLDMRPWQVPDYVIRQIRAQPIADVRPSGKPHPRDYGTLATLLFDEILCRDIQTASAARLVPEDAEDVEDIHRAAWTQATRNAGTDELLPSRARDIVESAAALFAALTARHIPAPVATQAALFGTELLSPYVSDEVLSAAQDLLQQTLDDDLLR